MLPGITQHTVKKHRWAKQSRLTDLKPVYHKFLNRVKKYVDDLKIEGGKVAGNITDEGISASRNGEPRVKLA